MNEFIDDLDLVNLSSLGLVKNDRLKEIIP